MPETEGREVTLKDGRKAVIREGIGKDLLDAQRKAGDPNEVQWSLLAEITEIDGKKLPWEDYLDMPLDDIFALFGELMKKMGNLPSLAPNTSSTSAK